MGAEGSTGLLLVRVSGAGFETIPLDYCLSEQSLLPRILTELLEQVDLVLLEALRVRLYEYRPPDRVTVLTREGNRIPWDGEDGHINKPSFQYCSSLKHGIMSSNLRRCMIGF